MNPSNIKYPFLGKIEGAEKAFLKGRNDRESDLQSAITYFLEFLRGFESMDIEGPCVTVFGSARFTEDHIYYEMARELGGELARAGYAVMTGGGPGILDEASEVITLVQCNKLDRFPVISLGGKEFWGGLRSFMEDTMLKEGVISPEDTDFIAGANSAREVIEVLKNENIGR